MFRVTVWKKGQTHQYRVDLAQLRREVAAWMEDEDCTAIIIHKTDDSGATCTCNVGAQPCPLHPGNTKQPMERIQFEKDWDAKVKKGQQQ